jgi:hypothetical protein
MTVRSIGTSMEYDPADIGGDSIEELESILEQLTYRRQIVDSTKYDGPETVAAIDGDIVRVTQELRTRA